MTNSQEMQTAMVNRSIRTIKAELEFLTDAAVISPQTLNELLSAIPEQTAMRAPLSVGALPSALPSVPTAQPLPTNGMNNMSLNEKSDYRDPSPAPPPAYAAPPTMPPLAHATALYAYNGEDAGDLSLQQGDRVSVSEYVNAEWWRGTCLRTGQQGIFPMSYVKVVDEKMPQQAPTMPQPTNYGNMPLQVSATGDGSGAAPSKGQEMGKKFGKKLGNAAIFGAGATIGGNIVNSIF